MTRLEELTDSELAATEVSVAVSVLLTATDNAQGDRNVNQWLHIVCV